MSLVLNNVSSGYRGRPVLSGIDLPPIAPGTMVALLGANAAGKSTLLKALAGLLAARGEARIGDIDLLALPPAARQRYLSYVPQTPLRPSALRVREFVSASLRAAGLSLDGLDGRVAEAFSRLGLNDFADEPLDRLSGGRRQLVAASLALIRRSRLALLDEPTSALDLKWQVGLLNALRENGRRTGAVTLVAMHEINLALRHTDQIALLAGGRVIAAGPPHDVLTGALLRQAYDVPARIELLADGTSVVIAGHHDFEGAAA